MNSRLASVVVCAVAAISWLTSAVPAHAQYSGPPKDGLMSKGDMPAGVTPDDLKKVAFEQRLNAQLPLDLPFRDETGKAVTLGDFFHRDRPVVLSLVYYDCPMLCTLVLNGLASSMKGMSLEPGQDYDLVTVSFDRRETPELAAAKKKTYIERYGDPDAGRAWHFLTGNDAAIKQLTEAVGFHYVYDEKTGQYAHAAGIMIATPEGKLAKYLYGIEYAPRDVRLALVDASAGRIGSAVDSILLYCYHYDPASGKYGLVVMNVIRLGGLVTMVVLGSFIAAMAVRDRRQKRALRDAQPAAAPAQRATRDQ